MQTEASAHVLWRVSDMQLWCEFDCPDRRMFESLKEQTAARERRRPLTHADRQLLLRADREARRRMAVQGNTSEPAGRNRPEHIGRIVQRVVNPLRVREALHA